MPVIILQRTFDSFIYYESMDILWSGTSISAQLSETIIAV